jgi:hypothetical protein
VAQLNGFYAAGDSGTAPICENLPIDVLVAKDTDALWSDRKSWVWREAPAFGSNYFRMFSCRKTRASIR